MWWQYAGRGGSMVWCGGSMQVVVWCGVVTVCRSWWCDVVWWQYAGRGGGVM